MDEQVRAGLCELLATSGRDICTTPRMLGILLHQRCPQAAEPVRELELALQHGCVGPLLAGEGDVDEANLAARLSAATGLDDHRARWAIATWAHALGTAAGPTVADNWSSWNRLDVSEATAGGTGNYQRAIWHLGVVALAGAAGGLSLGFYLLARGEYALIEPWREALQGLAPWLQVISLMLLGSLGGFAGGLLGWIFGGGQSWTYDVLGGTTLGRLVYSAAGAFNGAGVGVMCSLGFFGLIAVLPGALVGAGLGAFLGLLSAERIARYRYWW